MKKNIAVLAGDGVGPEITNEAVKVLKAIAKMYKHELSFTEALIGAAAIDQTGNPLPKETIALCEKADAVLFGAVGDPKYDVDPTTKVRPEQGLLQLRKTLGLYANIRPIRTFPNVHSSPLKDEIIKDVDFIVVRELTGGMYFGEKGRRDNGTTAFDINTYSKQEIERVATYAFKLALTRSSRITVVDKANVLETSRLWRETIQQQSKQWSNITIDFMFVDNAAMQLMKKPSGFDVILTDNMFGDILSDEASVIAGSIGLLPSASVGKKTSLYEPIHGSYPKAKGKNSANPIGSILSAAMLLEYSFGLKKESKAVYEAVETVLKKEYGTKDLSPKHILSTSEMGEAIIQQI